MKDLPITISYRVASHLATQNRALIGANAGKDAKSFIELVSTNARNTIIYGGGNYDDAKFYSNQFGEELERKIERGISRPVMNPLYGVAKNYRPNESIREVEKNVACYTPSDIIYKDFGYVTYSLIKRNSLQPAGVSKLSFISKELKENIENIVNELVLSELDFDKEPLEVSDLGVINKVGVTQEDLINSDDYILTGIPIGNEDLNLDSLIDFDIEDTLAVALDTPNHLTAFDLTQPLPNGVGDSVTSRSSTTLSEVEDDDA